MSLSLPQVIAGLSFWLIAVAVMASSYKRLIRVCLRFRALTLFALYAVVSSLWSPDVVNSLRQSLFLAILILFGYFLAERYQPEEQMRLIFVVGCLTIVGSLLVIALIPNRGIMPRGEWNGIFGHKNALGIYLSIYIAPLFFVKRKLGVVKIFCLIWVLVGVYVIYMSESRTGWLTCAFLMTYIFLAAILRRFKGLSSITILSVFLGIGVIVVSIVLANLSYLTRFLGRDSSLTGRTVIWRDALWAISRHMFFGYGYSGFWNGLTPESNAVNVQISSALSGQEFNHAHNAILTLVLQVGLVGMAILAIPIVKAFRDGLKAIITYRSNAALWYMSILLALLVAGSDESMLM